VPRIPRGQQGGYAYHVINRGNGRVTVFHKPQDYEAFLSLLVEAKKRHRVKIFGFCLMPNHFHLVVEPAHPTALSQFMQWLLTSHVRRYHNHYRTSGHVWQGRFKSFPVQRDEHLITVLRYVLQNPVRAGLSSTAREWLWSSLRRPQLTDASPVVDEEQLTESVREDQLATVRVMFESAKAIRKKRLASRDGGDVRTREHVAPARPAAKREEK